MVRGGTWWLIPISGVPRHRNVGANDLAVSDQQTLQYRVGLNPHGPARVLSHRLWERRGACRTAPARPSPGRSRSGLYLAAVLRTADAHASATARLGSACPGNVAHPVFITNSVCSQGDVMALSSPSFLTRATSAFSPARQIGSKAAVTAASVCFIATWLAVLPVIQPPQLNPRIIVRMLPITTPQTPGLSHARCTCMSRLLVLRRMFENDSECRGALSGLGSGLKALPCSNPPSHRDSCRRPHDTVAHGHDAPAPAPSSRSPGRDSAGLGGRARSRRGRGPEPDGPGRSGRGVLGVPVRLSGAGAGANGIRAAPRSLSSLRHRHGRDLHSGHVARPTGPPPPGAITSRPHPLPGRTGRGDTRPHSRCCWHMPQRPLAAS